jgi:hypothetical protein
MAVRYAAILVFVLAVFCGSSGKIGGAAEPGWSPVVIATGAYREYLHSLPIEQRPYRPLHFYGNTIRWLHHRVIPCLSSRQVLPRVGSCGCKMNGLPR